MENTNLEVLIHEMLQRQNKLMLQNIMPRLEALELNQKTLARDRITPLEHAVREQQRDIMDIKSLFEGTAEHDSDVREH